MTGGSSAACPAGAGRDPAAPGLKARPVGDGSVGAGVAGMLSWERGAELPASEAAAPAAPGRPDVRLLRGEPWEPFIGGVEERRSRVASSDTTGLWLPGIELISRN